MADFPVLAAFGAVCAAWVCVIAIAKPRLVLYLLFAFVPTQFLFVPVSGFFVSPHAHSANTTKQQVPGLRSRGRQV